MTGPLTARAPPSTRSRRRIPTSASSTSRTRAGPAGREMSGLEAAACRLRPVPRPRRPPRVGGRRPAVRPRRPGRQRRRPRPIRRPRPARRLATELADARAGPLHGRPRPRAHLKPHKLFRRQFLIDSEIRFPEGKRRLEDQAFVLTAYFLADAISVVGDYVCYHHHRRPDRGNAVSTPWEPAFYYKYVREDLDIIERYTTPGTFRNRLISRFIGVEMITRLSGPQVPRGDAGTSRSPARGDQLDPDRLRAARARRAHHPAGPGSDDARAGGSARPPRGARRGRVEGEPDGHGPSIAWREREGLAARPGRRAQAGGGRPVDRARSAPMAGRSASPTRVAAAVPAEQLHTQASILGVVEVRVIDVGRGRRRRSTRRSRSSRDVSTQRRRVASPVRASCPSPLPCPGTNRASRELRFQVRFASRHAASTRTSSSPRESRLTSLTHRPAPRATNDRAFD